MGGGQGSFISRCITRFLLYSLLIGVMYLSKPSWIYFKCAFFVLLFWMANSSNYHRGCPCNILCIYLIRPANVLVLVPSIYILYFFRSPRKYSGWPFSKVSILSSYSYDASDSGLCCIFTLMIFLVHYYSSYSLIRWISGGSIRDWISEISWGLI